MKAIRKQKVKKPVFVLSLKQFFSLGMNDPHMNLVGVKRYIVCYTERGKKKKIGVILSKDTRTFQDETLFI